MKQTLIVLLIFISSLSFGQVLENYNLSLEGMHLPGGGGRYEIYSMSNGKRKHTSFESNVIHKRRKYRSNEQIENSIIMLDSLFRLTEFKFTVNKSIIDSIKLRNDRNKFHKIPNADIDKFFSNGDTVTLRLQDIKPPMLEGSVIDGYAYFFYLSIKRPNQDSIKYEFNGNFYDGVQTSNIKNWLPIYLAYRQSKFLETMPMEKYFTNKNLESVLLRFIEWTK
jgi:hypothetical protein